jgi:polysaccharide pyruvyl transferase WcaK-like protein
MKILVVGNGGHNKGSASVIKSTIWMLKEENHDTKVSLLTYFPDFDAEQTNVRTFRFPTLQQGVGTKIKSVLAIIQCTFLALMYKFVKFDEKWLANADRLRLLQAFTTSDCVVFCGTDDISSTYGFIYPIDILFKGLFIGTLLNRPVLINAAQIGPFSENIKGKILARVVQIMFNRAELITVRDKISRNELTRIGITRPRNYLTADPAFLLQPASNERSKQILLEEGIGVNLSALIQRYSDNSKSEGQSESYASLAIRMIRHIIEELEADVVLIPHVFATGNDDRTVCKQIQQKINRKDKLFMINHEYSPEEFKGIIGQVDFLISFRMHPVIHSISMGTPVIAIDYTFKASELMRRINQENLVCHITSIEYKELISKIEAAYSNRVEIAKKMRIQSKVMQKHAYSNAVIMMEHLKKTKNCC